MPLNRERAHNPMPSRRLAPAILLLAIALIALASECVYAAPQDTESMPLDVANLLTYEGLLPFISFQYPVDAKISGDDLYVEQQYLGYMVSIEPGASVPGQAYFQATVMLTKSYDSAIDVMDHYLMELDHYMEPDFSHHTISASVRADGERFASFAGRGYVAHGIVVADGPLQGMSFSEEFHNFVLPGNVDLRVIFKYPTAVQNNEDMRKVFELILSSLTVHSDYFYLAGETRIDSLKRRHRN